MKARKLIKVFVITIVLLLPVIVFLFLKQFGSNEFVLPIYYENGHPLEQCSTDSTGHHLSSEFKADYNLSSPLIIAFEGEYENEFIYDLQNVLEKYSAIGVTELNLCCISEETKLKILNCELVLGEDRYINEVELNKYVLIDSESRIRGYFKIDELDEINRLDMELDILLNY